MKKLVLLFMIVMIGKSLFSQNFYINKDSIKYQLMLVVQKKMNETLPNNDTVILNQSILGFRNGSWIFTRKNGYIKKIENYKAGKLHGMCWYYNLKGELKALKIYNMNKVELVIKGEKEIIFNKEKFGGINF